MHSMHSTTTKSFYTCTIVIVLKFQKEMVVEFTAALSFCVCWQFRLLVLLGHSVSEVSNFSQFSGSYLEPCGPMGKQEEPCYLFVWDSN